MVSAHDVAAYILRKQGPLSAMKLQKLVYYAQAWSTVWDDQPLFSEAVEAWANGPVVRELYDVIELAPACEVSAALRQPEVEDRWQQSA